MSDCVVEKPESSSCTAEVFRIHLEPHPDADSLSLVHKDEYTLVVKSQDWAEGQLAVHITPDTMVDTNLPIFSWVPDADPEGWARVKTRRFRGIYSYGLLVPVDEPEGTDLWTALGLKRYEPKLPMAFGGDSIAVPFYEKFPVYDLESWFKHGKLLNEGESIIITEKIHGMNARFVLWEGEIYAGSHYTWKKQDSKNIVWQAVSQNTWIVEACMENPGTCFYGEIYGQVQDLKYGAEKNELRIAVFDAMKDGLYIPALQLIQRPQFNALQHPPVLYYGPYSRDVIMENITGPSEVPRAKHLREGIVIEATTRKPANRLKLKAVSPEYLSRKN